MQSLFPLGQVVSEKVFMYVARRHLPHQMPRFGQGVLMRRKRAMVWQQNVLNGLAKLCMK